MTSVALLRGINVGGTNKVEMPRLRALFERHGMKDVVTYINTGNVIFSHSESQRASLATTLEGTINSEFGLAIRVLVRDGDHIRRIADAIPEGWAEDDSSRCDVVYLWDEIDRPSLVDDMPLNPDVEEVRYTPGALIWRIDREHAAKSRKTRLVGGSLYASMTTRNANTARAIASLATSDAN